MPDNQNENKFMAMLERRGIVRKAGSEDTKLESSPVPGSDQSRAEADIRSLFGSPTSESIKVTPVARQPVPGMPNPILHGDQQQNTSREQPQHLESRVVELTDIDKTAVDESLLQPMQERNADVPDSDKSRFSEVSNQGLQNASQTVMDPQGSITQKEEENEMSKPLTFPGGIDTFSDAMSQGKTSAASEGPERHDFLQEKSAEDYTDRYLDIEDLYEVLSLKSKRTDTIYLVEEYLKSLPDSLPDESRREIVSKIIAASGFDYDLLMGDGVLRVKMLKDYAQQFADHTDKYVAACQAELEELDKQIFRVRKLIESRRELHKKQFFAIEAEAQRLKEILEFIGG